MGEQRMLTLDGLAAWGRAYLEDSEQLIGADGKLEGLDVTHKQATDLLTDFITYVVEG